MHGYQLMEAIADRTAGRWRPSPGAVYPTLSQLEDEGLITLTAGGGRRLATLTEAGRELVEREGESWSDPFPPAPQGDDGVDLRAEMVQLHEAVRLVGRSGTDQQRVQVAHLITEARRNVYLVLAGPPSPTNDVDRDPTSPAQEDDER